MTSKLKCPVCGSELSLVIAMYSCEKCGLYCNQKAKDALIQAKQDLEIAVDALKRIKEPTAWGSLYQEQEIATEALKQIGTTTETKGKKNEQQTSNQKQ